MLVSFTHHTPDTPQRVTSSSLKYLFSVGCLVSTFWKVRFKGCFSHFSSGVVTAA